MVKKQCGYFQEMCYNSTTESFLVFLAVSIHFTKWQGHLVLKDQK
jgi:hypothetical protein